MLNELFDSIGRNNFGVLVQSNVANMNAETKNKLLLVFRVLIVIVLACEILNWFLNFGDTTNYILNATMFSLIGIAFIVAGIHWDNKVIKLIMVLCGFFLLICNFLPENIAFEIIGIACIIVPMVISRFSKENDKIQPNHA